MSRHGEPAPGRKKIPVLLWARDLDEIRAAAVREGVSVSAFLVLAGLDRARAVPPSVALVEAVRGVRVRVREIDDRVEELDAALDAVSEAARIPPAEEH